MEFKLAGFPCGCVYRPSRWLSNLNLPSTMASRAWKVEVESGLPSLLIGVNQTGFAVNTTFRDGGLPGPRPGIVNREMTFPDEYTRAGLEDGLFQGAGTYTSDDGRSFIAASVSGRIFTIEITTGFPVVEITIPDDPNQQLEPHTWFQQAERWLVVQNGLNIPFLFDGAGSRRATEREVPVGGPMAYGKGRLWVARRNLYFGGDVLGGDSSYGRDNVIRFTENDYLAEGGAFGAPDGPITGMAFAKNLDTSLGDGDLLVATVGNIYAFSAPIDRTVWKNLTQPLQRYAAMSFGAMAHESMVIVNGDLFYRSPDGIRTLAYSRRDFQSWGDVPISRSITRGLAYDTTFRLVSGSAVNFDNRALFTTQPQEDPEHGIWHRGLAVLDFHRASGMDRKLAPAWEGGLDRAADSANPHRHRRPISAVLHPRPVGQSAHPVVGADEIPPVRLRHRRHPHRVELRDAGNGVRASRGVEAAHGWRPVVRPDSRRGVGPCPVSAGRRRVLASVGGLVGLREVPGLRPGELHRVPVQPVSAYPSLPAPDAAVHGPTAAAGRSRRANRDADPRRVGSSRFGSRYQDRFGSSGCS
jgi:hypothetical protein